VARAPSSCNAFAVATFSSCLLCNCNCHDSNKCFTRCSIYENITKTLFCYCYNQNFFNDLALDETGVNHKLLHRVTPTSVNAAEHITSRISPGEAVPGYGSLDCSSDVIVVSLSNNWSSLLSYYSH